MADYSPDIEGRVRTLEVTVNSLANTVDKYIDSSQKNDAAIASKLETLSGQISSQGKPQWSVLGTMFGVAMMIVGYYVSGQVNPLQSKLDTHERSIESLNNDIKDGTRLRYTSQDAVKDRSEILVLINNLQIKDRVQDEERLTLHKDVAKMEVMWDLYDKGLLLSPSNK